MYQQPSYPTVQFLLRHGDLVAACVGALPLVAGLVSLIFSAPALIIIPAAGASALLWLLLKSYVEVLAIIADTLLPK